MSTYVMRKVYHAVTCPHCHSEEGPFGRLPRPDGPLIAEMAQFVVCGLCRQHFLLQFGIIQILPGDTRESASEVDPFPCDFDFQAEETPVRRIRRPPEESHDSGETAESPY